MIEAVDFSLLGTVVRVRASTPRMRSPRRSADRVLAEIARLSQTFNIYEPDSVISQCRANGTCDDPTLRTVIELAEQWQARTEGLFDPRVSGALDLNGIAKGWIVDRGAESAGSTVELVIDAGGDVLHRGGGSVRVGIEDPVHPFDNVAPMEVIEIANASVATSSSARRPGHLIRSSTPAGDDCVSASVVAADAATADVLATAFAVASADRALALAEELDVAAFVVAASGERHGNERWASFRAA